MIRHARRAAVFVVGVTVILIGVVMFFTPGPAMIVIPAGIGILATEFIWARRLLHKMKKTAKNLTGIGKKDDNKAKGPSDPSDPSDTSDCCR